MPICCERVVSHLMLLLGSSETMQEDGLMQYLLQGQCSLNDSARNCFIDLSLGWGSPKADTKTRI